MRRPKQILVWVLACCNTYLLKSTTDATYCYSEVRVHAYNIVVSVTVILPFSRKEKDDIDQSTFQYKKEEHTGGCKSKAHQMYQTCESTTWWQTAALISTTRSLEALWHRFIMLQRTCTKCPELEPVREYIVSMCSTRAALKCTYFYLYLYSACTCTCTVLVLVFVVVLVQCVARSAPRPARRRVLPSEQAGEAIKDSC